MPDNYGQQFVSGSNVAATTTWVTPNIAPPEVRILLLDEATQAVENSTKFALSMADEVRQIADGILGAQPMPGTSTTVSGANKMAGPTPRAYGLRDGTSALSNALSVLYSEIQRLRAL